jgi:opacity protein-like surface antigen
MPGYTVGMKFGVLILSLGVSAVASAQDRGAAVSGSVFAVNMDSRTGAALSGALAYRFSRVVELEIETTWVPKVRSAWPTGPVVIQLSQSSTFFTSGSVVPNSSQIFPAPYYANPGGRIVMFTNAARINIPTTSSRLNPYFAAGGGVAHTRRTADFIYPIFLPVTVTAPVPSNAPPLVRQTTERVTAATTDLALTLGGGVDVRIASALSVDADLRLFRLLGQEDRNLGRFGVGLRYRF